MIRYPFRLAVAFSVMTLTAPASSTLPFTPAAHVREAACVVRGTVVQLEALRAQPHGGLHTRVTVRVDEPIKGGDRGQRLTLLHPGGELNGIAAINGWSPDLRVGEERLFFLGALGDGTFHCLHGSLSAIRLTRVNRRWSPRDEALLAEVRGHAAGATPDRPMETGDGPEPQGGGCDQIPGGTYGLRLAADNVPTRFIAPDRAEQIPFLVDAAALPAGITLSSALAAVSNAVAAWSGVSSVRFRFEGLQSFGMPAANVQIFDARLRIQLHDSYGYIPGPNTLGIGGFYPNQVLLPGVGWGEGGNVAGQEFYETRAGFVTLKHSNSAMTNLATFTEVLTHEIGHALGLAHSSETATSDPCLSDALMFWQAHGDGRGASVRDWDIAVVNKVHPQSNTPPWGYHRVMDVVSAFTTPNVPGINQVDLRGYDLQGANPTLIMTNLVADNGTFSQAGTVVSYTPDGAFGDSIRADPADPFSFSYDRFHARYSDGVHASPFVIFRVVSLSFDDYPSTSDGIPDRWMTAYFGNPNPAAGPNRGATQDWDGDRLNNLNEYRSGMNPRDASNAQRITAIAPGTLQWQAQAYELYEILGSNNLTTWSRIAVHQPTNASFGVRTSLPQTNIIATFSNLPTAGPRMFYRVLKVP